MKRNNSKKKLIIVHIYIYINIFIHNYLNKYNKLHKIKLIGKKYLTPSFFVLLLSSLI